jgi:hypothetical protein
LALIYEDTEAKTTAEIKNSAYKITHQQSRIVLAQESVLDLRKRVEELEKTRDSENVAIFQISEARTDLDQAEADLIQQVVDLKLAQVDLKKAQGMLANECGFLPQLCLEGCCDGACTRCEGGLCGNCQCTSCATGKPCSTCK